jgi:hypothetical protein
MKYDVDYFINKFEAIPEDKWHIGALRNEDGYKRCALGHCCGESIPEYFGITNRPTEMCNDLSNFFRGLINADVGIVNDGSDTRYKQSTPKQRILAALRDIKKLQQPSYPDLTKSLAVLPEDKIEVDVKVKENCKIQID